MDKMTEQPRQPVDPIAAREALRLLDEAWSYAEVVPPLAGDAEQDYALAEAA
jgi:hypothetical protein